MVRQLTIMTNKLNSEHQGALENTIYTYTQLLGFIENDAYWGEDLYQCVDMQDTELPQKVITNTMREVQIAGFFNSLATGIINVLELAKKAMTEPEITTIIINKKLSKADQIRNKQKEDKFKYKFSEYIRMLDVMETSILMADLITAEYLKSFLSNVDNFIKECSSVTNNLMLCRKITIFYILRSLVNKYKLTSYNHELIELILEFYLLTNDFKDEWNIETGEQTKQKIGGRKKLGKTLDQEYKHPTYEELIANELSSNDNLVKAIKHYITITKEILDELKINPIEFQMKYLYHKIPPFSIWNPPVFKLDEWQIEVIKLIDNNESVVISAPTSSGKTVCALYCALKKDNTPRYVIYVVPCDELAVQVAASFNKNGVSVSFSTNRGDYKKYDQTNVIVATPNKAEQIYLSLISQNKKIDYIVFDEIQQINEREGANIELLLKTCNCPFLILSATIANPEKFIEYLERIKDQKINLIVHNKRFIVQQKYIYNGLELRKLHPYACIDLDYIINDGFTSGDLSMTPCDIYQLAGVMLEQCPDEILFDPNEYFKLNPRLTNDSCRDYEVFLIEHLINLARTEPDKVVKILDKFKLTDYPIWNPVDRTVIDMVPSMVNLFTNMKDSNLLPALVFKCKDMEVLQIYKSTIAYLEEREDFLFNWYKEFYEKIFTNIQTFNDNEEAEREKLVSGMKINKKSSTKKQINKKEINEQYNLIKLNFIKNILQMIQNKYLNVIKHLETSTRYNDTDKLFIKEFLEKDYESIKYKWLISQESSSNIELPRLNPYAPVSCFCFHKTPLTITFMQSLKHDLRKYLKVDDNSTSDAISYNNIFIKGIERGIILYSSILPTPFQRIVQELIVTNMSPLCICDSSLSYGVNYPARTVVIMGKPDIEEIDVLKAQQLSGRSGRRNLDTMGNIIYCGVNYYNIMRGGYSPLIGKETLTPYTFLSVKFRENLTEDWVESSMKIPLRSYMLEESYDSDEVLQTIGTLYTENHFFNLHPLGLYLTWLFRNQVNIAPNVHHMIDYIMNKLCKKEHYTMEINSGITEIICRVMDWTEDDQEDETSQIETLAINKSNKYYDEIKRFINSETLNVNIRKNNLDIIRSLLTNTIISDNNISHDFNDLGQTVSRIYNITQNILIVYNLFASIGKRDIVEVLEKPIDNMIKFLNKYQTFDI